MFPELFTIFGVKVDAYYVFWTLGLMLMVVWTRYRAVTFYKMTYNDATDVLFYVFLGGVVGALAGGFLQNMSLYLEQPRMILNYRLVGLSSAHGFLLAGAAGLWKLKKLGLRVNPFADAAAIPASFMLFIGRWGCFSEGCCQGIETDSSLGVHFHYLPEGIYAYPTQLFESTASLVIGVALLCYEWRSRRSKKGLLQGSLFALFFIGYGGYRFLFDALRDESIFLGMRPGQISGLLALLMGIIWLWTSKKRGLFYEG